MGLAVAAAVIVLALTGCGNSIAQTATGLTGGSPDRGSAAILRHGCGSCHQIDGIARARGQVGPSLNGLVNRMYIGGVLINTPENLMTWIQDPKAIDAKTAMPALGVTRKDAKDIAAYLYSIN